MVFQPAGLQFHILCPEYESALIHEEIAVEERTAGQVGKVGRVLVILVEGRGGYETEILRGITKVDELA